MKIGLYSFLLFALLACAGTNNETLSANEVVIERFVNSIRDYDTLLVLNRVSYVRMFKGDMSQSIALGDSVYFSFAARTLADTVPYETNVREIADHYRMDTTIRRFGLLGVVLGQGDLIPGLETGLLLGHSYDHAYIVFNSDLGYGTKPMGIVPPYSPLFFQVWIDRVRKRD